jgi:hypothetical protein
LPALGKEIGSWCLRFDQEEALCQLKVFQLVPFLPKVLIQDFMKKGRFFKVFGHYTTGRLREIWERFHAELLKHIRQEKNARIRNFWLLPLPSGVSD